MTLPPPLLSAFVCCAGADPQSTWARLTAQHNERKSPNEPALTTALITALDAKYSPVSAVVSADGARRMGDYRSVPALKVASTFSPSAHDGAAAGSPSGAVMGTPGSEPHAPHAPKTAPTTLAHSPPRTLQVQPRRYLSTTLTGEIADKVLEAARPLLEAKGIADVRTMTAPVLLPRGSGTGLVLGSAEVVSEVRCWRLIAC